MNTIATSATSSFLRTTLLRIKGIGRGLVTLTTCFSKRCLEWAVMQWCQRLECANMPTLGPRPDVLELDTRTHDQHHEIWCALSGPSGKVFWRVKGCGPGQILNFRWREKGGSPVFAPLRWGFGNHLFRYHLSQNPRARIAAVRPAGR